MNPTVIAALTRRASLLTLGAAGLTRVFAAPSTASAKKKRGKSQGKKGDAKKLCKRQVGQCLDVFIPLCADDLDCQATFMQCCPRLGICDFNGFTDCLNTVV